MCRFYGLILLAIACSAAPPLALADTVVMKGGNSYEVESFYLTPTQVVMVTRDAKLWSVMRDAVDLKETLRRNRMSSADVRSPRWQESSKLAEVEPAAIESKAESASEPYARPIQVFVTGQYSATERVFSDSRVFEWFAEDASLDSVYSGGPGPALEIGVVFPLTRKVSAGGAFEIFEGSHDVSFSESLPHPFFFDQPREITGTLLNLGYSERAFHGDVILTLATSRRWQVDVFGGPSLFWTRTVLLSDVLLDEDYPFDTVAFTPDAVEFDDKALGFNAGATATIRVTNYLGVDFGVRFSWAKVRIPTIDGTEVQFNAGGFRSGSGLRISF